MRSGAKTDTPRFALKTPSVPAFISTSPVTQSASSPDVMFGISYQGNRTTRLQFSPAIVNSCGPDLGSVISRCELGGRPGRKLTPGRLRTLGEGYLALW